MNQELEKLQRSSNKPTSEQTTETNTSIHFWVFSPHNDDDEVEQIPAVPNVGARVHHQTVGQDFQEGLHSEDDEEDVLHLFLNVERTFVTTDEDVFQSDTSPKLPIRSIINVVCMSICGHVMT